MGSYFLYNFTAKGLACYNLRMSEVSLYRKYRPQKFADVIGQEQVSSVLESTLKSGKVSHAYLFTGSRGTGKTSIARIFAHDLGTADTDITEIDAASNRNIDDIRELRDAVNTLPFESKYKIYIIDEVHMLTKEAFNALLKTLEEPPAHVIFILATTDLEKVPETVRSRCQTFIFKKPTRSVLAAMAIEVANKEGYTIDKGSADIIATLGDGSFRDTHGILEKVIRSSKSKKPTREDVEEITGAPKTTLVHDLLTALVSKDKEKALVAMSRRARQISRLGSCPFSSCAACVVRFFEKRARHEKADIRRGGRRRSCFSRIARRTCIIYRYHLKGALTSPRRP